MGESHKSLMLLTADLGLVPPPPTARTRCTAACAWAASRSRTARRRLYHDPVKNTYKVTDLEVRESFERPAGRPGRIEAASLWAEVVLKSFAAGDSPGASSGCCSTACAPWTHADPRDARTSPRSSSGDSSTWRGTARRGSVRALRPRSGETDAAWLTAPGRVRAAVRGCSPGHLRLAAGGRRYLEASRDRALAAARAIGLDARRCRAAGSAPRDPRRPRGGPRLAALPGSGAVRVFAALPLPEPARCGSWQPRSSRFAAPPRVVRWVPPAGVPPDPALLRRGGRRRAVRARRSRASPGLRGRRSRPVRQPRAVSRAGSPPRDLDRHSRARRTRVRSPTGFETRIADPGIPGGPEGFPRTSRSPACRGSPRGPPPGLVDGARRPALIS